jgi:hypothetical protein
VEASAAVVAVRTALCSTSCPFMLCHCVPTFDDFHVMHTILRGMHVVVDKAGRVHGRSLPRRASHADA